MLSIIAETDTYPEEHVEQFWLDAVPDAIRSTQPSTLCGTVEYQLSG